MSEFKVEVLEVVVKSHPNADRLEVVGICSTDYQCVVPKGKYQTGDLVAYIPEGSIVPENILEELGLVGMLAGPNHNRLKSRRFRGELSQGLCYPSRDGWEKGQDVTEELGVEKYVPPVPTNMSGDVYSLGPTYTIRYDLENLKKFPDALQDGEEVVMTEKIHGTNFQAGWIPEKDADDEHGQLVVASKGLGSKGLVFKPDAENNEHNVYMKAARRNELPDKLSRAHENFEGQPVFVLGEVYGIQDLKYGANTSLDVVGFAAFDVHVGYQSDGRYLNHDEFMDFCATYDIPTVPLLYRGPYSREIVQKHTNGPELVTGEEQHIREGIVIKPIEERNHIKLGRVILKSVSEDYLTRSHGTEMN